MEIFRTKDGTMEKATHGADGRSVEITDLPHLLVRLHLQGGGMLKLGTAVKEQRRRRALLTGLTALAERIRSPRSH